jgi:organic radical activating enzyme
MRCIQTFVLRLLLDPDVPETLRGSIVCISGGEPRTFTDAQGLIKLLAEAGRLLPQDQIDELAKKEGGPHEA